MRSVISTTRAAEDETEKACIKDEEEAERERKKWSIDYRVAFSTLHQRSSFIPTLLIYLSISISYRDIVFRFLCQDS